MPFTSSLVIVTSNIPLLTLTSSSETATALKRRLDSKQFVPRLPLGFYDENDIYHFTVKAKVLNVISADASTLAFSMFSETLTLLKESQIFEFEDLSEWGFSEDADIPNGNITGADILLTSSVPKSSSVVEYNSTTPSDLDIIHYPFGDDVCRSVEFRKSPINQNLYCICYVNTYPHLFEVVKTRY